MAHLAIQGHATRGNEVIALLKMLGGIDSGFFSGNETDRFYYIEVDKGICFIDSVVEHLDFHKMTLEQLLKRFPYKVGNRVKNVYGAYGKVYEMKWIDDEIQYRLDFGHHTSGWYGADELQPAEKKETMEEKKINQMSLVNCDLDEIEIVLGDKFELKMKGGKYYAVRKKPQYPTDYIDACSVLGISVTSQCEMDVVVFGDELYALYQLLVCRNVYWKIVGMEMRLGESWKPDWNNIQDKHCIYVVSGELWLKECQTRQCTLAFPTAEIRDAFYENFKDLIEQCKELL